MDAARRVRRYKDARAFLARAGSWLLEREVEHTLLLGVTHRLARSRRPGAAPTYLAVIEGGGGLEGCALRTPPWPLLVTEAPAEALSALVEDVGRAYPELPAVMGPKRTSAAFARRWAEAHELRATVGVEERLLRLDRWLPPAHPAPGRVREAAAADRDGLVAWLEEFAREADIMLPDAAATADRLLEEGAVVLWEHAGRPRSMAAIGGESPHTARIGYVYTPPAERGRGYATACVAGLSERLLRRGVEAVVLFTDLANPTSNALYARLGYRPVEDSTLWRFGPSRARGDARISHST
ncbi:MAG: GNAT family N-acetyltransferase [Candidatus Palauibacterales bacterium]|nr:GNAT family N-acetyltransferase [Candidatus Palauibacterales bacterium]MDP2529457.1 GNAT family N-acetyltransferase [Candidatus Palauibacterales bacterium]MDP2585195.1 GNAT family N-acetyltransferase [Candidatus Palauibacterales bacterium]